MKAYFLNGYFMRGYFMRGYFPRGYFLRLLSEVISEMLLSEGIFLEVTF